MAEHGSEHPGGADDAHDDHETHAIIERYERGWMVFALAMLVVFTVLVFHAVAEHGAQIARTDGRQAPSTILAEERFAQPGVRRTGPSSFEVSSVVQSFSFLPPEIYLPAGAEATFHIASRDVIHGYQVMNTPINFEIIPGEVATFRYTFREPGEYRVVCNQYCGIGHHNMLGLIVVESPEVFAVREEEAVTELPTDQPLTDEAFDWPALGAEVYNTNCAACHQAGGEGVAGVFPSLAGHLPNFIDWAHYPEFIEADVGRQYLVDVLLYGLVGEIVVGGQTYNGVMPAFAHLSDQQIAAVLNHSLFEWGNDELLPPAFAPYVPGEVTLRRDQGLSPEDVYEARGRLERE